MRLLLFICAAFAVAGCIISTTDMAGEPCEAREDCDDAFYDCVAAVPDGPRTCQVIYPPGANTDGGDAGVIEPAYWCSEVQPLMVTYCSSCHGADRSGSGNLMFRLDVYEDDPDAGLPGAKTKAERIYQRTVVWKDMPPANSGVPLPTDAERELVRRWALTGAQLCADGGTP